MSNAYDDSSSHAHTITTGGSPTFVTSPVKFGFTSMQLNGSSYLTTADSVDWYFASADFTIDFWAYVTSGASGYINFVEQYQDSSNFWILYHSSNGNTYFQQNHSGSVEFNPAWAWTPLPNTWYHLALVRSGTNLYLFVNGSSQGTKTLSLAVRDIAGALNISKTDLGIGGVTGNIDEFRISNIARWTSNFTPPVAAYSSDANTFLLLHLDTPATVKTILSDADIKGTTVKTISSNADIKNTTVQTKTSDATIKKISTTTILSDADIYGTTIKTISSSADIKNTTIKTIFSDAKIHIPTVQSILSDAVIKHITTQNILSDTDIAGTTVKTITSDADIKNTTTKTITSYADITASIQRTITSNCQIVLTNIGTISSDAIILTPLDLDVEVSFTKNSQKDIDIQVEVIQVVPGIPFNVTALNVGSGDAVRIEWDGTASFFNVYMVGSGPTYTKVNAYLITDHFYVVGGLTEGVSYTFVVRGSDGQG